jgi:hypothetical protein
LTKFISGIQFSIVNNGNTVQIRHSEISAGYTES